MKLANINKFFPYNNLEAYHKDLGYSIPFNTVDELPTIIQNAKITHFSIIDNTVIVYCEE